MKKPIAVAMSGGVDSLVAAALLIEAGHRVFGLHFLTGTEADPEAPLPPSELSSACRILGIDLFAVDLSAEFTRHVTDFFVSSYAQGLTPNPCMACNRAVKFGALAARAREMGAEHLATGHYARLLRDPGGARALARASDSSKDQSYFLAWVPAAELFRALFPLGELSKDRVRALAAERGIAELSKPESQEACFLAGGGLGEFLALSGLPARPGPIVDSEGKVLGRHQGVHSYTVGQRRGIGVPAAEPLYVLGVDPAARRLVVGPEDRLYSRVARVDDINWLVEEPRAPIRVEARIRFRHREAPALLTPGPGRSATLVFDSPQKAVTPGQGAVFYNKDRVLGGGRIVIAMPEGLSQAQF